MTNRYKDAGAHSAEHFGDTRDHWWNLDFLKLMAKRWSFDRVRDVLDVGCGVGHWSTLLASVMREETHFTGIDRERLWIEQARVRAEARGLSARFEYVHASAERLPFPDDRFDLTTCQTVLIHVADPVAVIREMLRVTRSGGLIVVAEPNNLTTSVLLDSISNLASVAAVTELVRFQLTCERGKVALGEGDNSLGDRVPGLFAALGLERIEVYVNDKAMAMFPPYLADSQALEAEEMRDRTARGLWNWDRAQTQRFYEAGGGLESEFSELFERALASRQKLVRGLEVGTYHGILGGAFYLVGGQKSASARGDE
jgi:2-polyprenyl-3-methyl-5-hydroxy-6-metoxy-1,4-benzoquinol methylase